MRPARAPPQAVVAQMRENTTAARRMGIGFLMRTNLIECTAVKIRRSWVRAPTRGARPVSNDLHFTQPRTGPMSLEETFATRRWIRPAHSSAGAPASVRSSRSSRWHARDRRKHGDFQRRGGRAPQAAPVRCARVARCILRRASEGAQPAARIVGCQTSLTIRLSSTR